MSELRELYQEVILDHGKRPRNFGAPEHWDCHAAGHNPLCGDRLELYLALDGDRVRDARFTGSGCAISTASASMMTEALRGLTLDEAEALFRAFHDLVTGKREPDPGDARLEKLVVFAGVREFPLRVKCATLGWHTFRAAVANRDETVSTE
jgi:nitrogen fixation NifU-like protein